MSTTYTARDWIQIWPAGVQSDIARLGINAAAEYQMSLIILRHSWGDKRWVGITTEDMVRALRDFVNSETLTST